VPQKMDREYVRRIREESQRFTTEQQALVQRLGEMVATLEADRGRLEARVQLMQEELLRRDRDQAELRHQVAEIVCENERLAGEYGAVERRSAELASLYVAAFRLHSTLDRGEVLTAIQEVIQSLIGCEEVIIFKREGDVLRPLTAFGVEPQPWDPVRIGAGAIGRAAGRARCWINPEPDAGPPSDATLTVCIPLVLDGRVTGAIALFQMLGHKLGLEPVDHELFELLSSHAATALYATELHESAARLVAQPDPARHDGGGNGDTQRQSDAGDAAPPTSTGLSA